MNLLFRVLRKIKRIIQKITPPYIVPEILYSRRYGNLTVNKQLCSDAILSTFDKGCKVLDKLGIDFYIGRGTLLGLHRDGNFISGDKDIDIDIFSDDQIYEIIQKMPFEVFLISNSNGHYQQVAFLDKETNVIFDLWFYYKKEKQQQYINRNHYGYFSLPANKVEKPHEILFNGKKYNCLEPKWYCDYWYGKNWQTPEHYDGNWTSYYRKTCSAFKYLGLKNVINI
jgi:hypothetical protein